jgi:hypothetical protein
MFVAGIQDTRPKTRTFVSEMPWAYQTKTAFSDMDELAGSNSVGKMNAQSRCRTPNVGLATHPSETYLSVDRQTRPFRKWNH